MGPVAPRDSKCQDILVTMAIMMLSGPDPTKPTTSVSVRFSDRLTDQAPFGPNRNYGMGPSTDGDHEDSSHVSTSSGDTDCQLVYD